MFLYSGQGATKALKDSELADRTKAAQGVFINDIKKGFKELKNDIERQRKQR